MTYYVLAGCLALAVFFSINALGSLIATAFWFCLRQSPRRWRAATRASVIFWLRAAPAAFALAFVTVLMLPAYLIHEPHPSPENVGFALFALAVCSACGIGLALFRAVASMRATRRLKAAWLRSAESVSLSGVAIPAYVLRHSTPVIAVVGVVRPALFIAGQVLESLSREELKVALTHENGHLVARDTLRRAVLSFCRNLLLIGVGRTLDRAWAEESERAADEYAARAGAGVALDLAAALIKIARLMPAGVNNVVPAGAFLLEGGDNGVAGRVRRLTELASTRATPADGEFQFPKAALLAGLTGLTTASAALAADWQVLATVHAFTERVVKLLA